MALPYPAERLGSLSSVAVSTAPAAASDIDWEGPNAPIHPNVAAAEAALAMASSSLPRLPPIGLPGLGLPGLPSFDFGALLALPALDVSGAAQRVAEELLEALFAVARDAGLDIDIEAGWRPETLAAELSRAAGALGAEARRLVSRAVADAFARATIPKVTLPVIPPVGLPGLGLPSLPSYAALAALLAELPRLTMPSPAELERLAAEALMSALGALELDLDLEAAGSLADLQRLAAQATRALAPAEARALGAELAEIQAKTVPGAAILPPLPSIGLPGLGLPGLPSLDFDLSL